MLSGSVVHAGDSKCAKESEEYLELMVSISIRTGKSAAYNLPRQ